MIRSILFVCLGNICRSPMAEGAMRAEAARRGLALDVESAAIIGWHAGEPPDPRATRRAAAANVDISEQRARQIDYRDFSAFDLIVALDRQILDDLNSMAPAGSRAEIALLLDHVAGREGEEVADPYHGDAAAFDRAWRDIAGGIGALAGRIAGEAADQPSG